LASVGFELREAGNGQEALDLWRDWHPHLICMDLHMPKLDGLEATRRIKATDAGHHTKIIAVTASSFEEERAEILATGCDDFLRKPFQEAELFALLQKHLGVRYVYEGEPAASLAPTLSAEQTIAALLSLPESLKMALEQALTQLDTQQVQQVVGHIRTHHPTLADTLTSLANNFEYSRILHWLREIAPDPQQNEQA
jgi:CheY-like chemotaxis protein